MNITIAAESLSDLPTAARAWPTCAARMPE
jgi:hypothetical protein